MDRAKLSKFEAALARALDADTMMRMARTSGFCQRMRSVTAQELAVAVIAAMATQSTQTIADVQRMLTSEEDDVRAARLEAFPAPPARAETSERSEPTRAQGQAHGHAGGQHPS
jgi:hypothetical protein